MTAPRKYRPSNGTEGMSFMAHFCDRCAIRGICKILPRTFAFDVDNPAYPHHWTYDENGAPTCTSFTERPTHRQRAACKRTVDLFQRQP